MTGVERQPRSVVDAVTDAAIAALLPADRQLSIAAAEHRDRAHVDAALDRLLPRTASHAERSRIRRAALDRLAASRTRRVAAARQRGLDAGRSTRGRWCR